VGKFYQMLTVFKSTEGTRQIFGSLYKWTKIQEGRLFNKNTGLCKKKTEVLGLGPARCCAI